MKMCKYVRVPGAKKTDSLKNTKGKMEKKMNDLCEQLAIADGKISGKFT